MNKKHLAKLNMAETCLAVVYKPDHARAFEGSSKAWKDSIRQGDELVAAILETSNELTGSKGVTSAGKRDALAQLGERAWSIASSLHAMAAANNFADLVASTRPLSRRRLLKGSSTLILDRCTDIHRWAIEHLQMIAADDVTEADVKALKDSMDAFDSVKTRPRTARAAGRAASRRLEMLFGKLTRLFKDQLDKLVVKFKDQEPKFYEAYWAARVIVDPASRSRAATPAPVLAPSAQSQSNAGAMRSDGKCGVEPRSQPDAPANAGRASCSDSHATGPAWLRSGNQPPGHW